MIRIFQNIILTTTMAITYQVVFAQADYYPLDLGNSWAYGLIDNDGELIDSSIWTLLSSEAVPDPEPMTIYTMQISVGSDVDTFYMYELESAPNVVNIVNRYEYALELQCDEILLHSYEGVDSTLCIGEPTRYSEYYGTYETLEGLVFEDCWLSYELDDSMREELIFAAPNVGFIANYEDSDKLVPNQEILSYNILISSDHLVANVDFELYPNPAEDLLQIKHSSSVDADYVYILNVQGQIVKSANFSNNLKVDVNALNKGHYTVLFQKNNHVIGRSSFVKL